MDEFTIAVVLFIAVFLGFVAYKVYSIETSFRSGEVRSIDLLVGLRPSQRETSFSSNDFQKALAAQNPTNICATPAGYTDESWREHMSHHPDMYKECLK